MALDDLSSTPTPTTGLPVESAAPRRARTGVEACEKLPDTGKNNGYNIQAAEEGATLECRTLHVARAVTNPESASAPMNCAAALGAAPCR